MDARTGGNERFDVIQFSIDQWRAWAPGLDDADDWTRWSLDPECASGEPTAEPVVDFLPAMQRRRMSRLARMTFQVAWPLAEGQAPMPMVFASRHGETPRTFALLSELAERQPLSPTQFSLSVHNAIIGLWSILRSDDSEMTSIAAEGDGLEHALLEAAGLLAEGAPQVLLVIAEDRPPQAYAPWIDDVPFPYAVALRLRRGTQWTLSCDTSSAKAPASRWPHALNFLLTLLQGGALCSNLWKGRAWNWQRAQ
jgi:hypothetical protein